MTAARRKTRSVLVGNVRIGGRAPITVQSMTKTDTRDITKTVAQLERLRRAGCEIIRLAVADDAAAVAFGKIRKRVKLPLVADIHFDYRLALAAIKQGADKVRINPGNIGARWKVEEVMRCAADHRVAIRIGVNAGSIEKGILKKTRRPTAHALVESVRRSVDICEAVRFNRLVLSAKATDALETIEVYRQLARDYTYPLHLGMTEAGLTLRGGIRSAVGLGVLLHEGIGDTIRVSLTGDPVAEVIAGYEILRSLHRREYGPMVISCPTCGRCRINLIKIAEQVEAALVGCTRPLKVAVMGCSVNGPG
jgi:(E)-4-hydroxy-3-methylbut-2-enyl-diphosphate synthase